MQIMRELNPIGVARRCQRQLQRRIYTSKVTYNSSCSETGSVHHRYLTCRVQTFAGTWMVMTNYHPLDSTFMAALMGLLITAVVITALIAFFVGLT